MNIYDELENLKAEARSNPELAQALLATREMKNPVSAFCRIAQEHGCSFSEFDLVTAGEDSYAAMSRSTTAARAACPCGQIQCRAPSRRSRVLRAIRVRSPLSAITREAAAWIAAPSRLTAHGCARTPKRRAAS